MVVKLNVLVAIIGAALLGVGLILGLVPMTQSGISCGSAFSPSNTADAADFTNALGGLGVTDLGGQCRDALSGRRGIALALTIPGALLALGGAVATNANKPQAKVETAAR